MAQWHYWSAAWFQLEMSQQPADGLLWYFWWCFIMKCFHKYFSQERLYTERTNTIFYLCRIKMRAMSAGHHILRGEVEPDTLLMELIDTGGVGEENGRISGCDEETLMSLTSALDTMNCRWWGGGGLQWLRTEMTADWNRGKIWLVQLKEQTPIVSLFRRKQRERIVQDRV